jgi:hypothetical protein
LAIIHRSRSQESSYREQTRLDDDRNTPLFSRFLRGTPRGWQLQYGRALIFAQTCEQDHLSIREFKRIVVRHGVVQIDLPKAPEPPGDLLVRQNVDAEQRLAFDVLLKRDLGAGKQTHRYERLADRGETAGDEPLNFVTISLSSIFGGLDATWCRL